MTIIVLGRSKTQPPTGNDNGSVRTYSEAWDVVVSTQAEAGPFTVGTGTAGVATQDGGPPAPLIGQVHYDDPTAWCRDVSIACVDPWSGWRYSANYSSEWELNEDPKLDQIRILLDGEKYEEVVTVDQAGNPAGRNTAFDPFSPPLMKEKARRIINIETNLPGGIPTEFLSYEDAVNTDSVTIGGLLFTPRQLKMDVWRASTTLTRNGFDFVQASVAFHAKEETWDFSTLNQGFRELDAGGSPINIINAGDSEPIAEPALLDINGKAILNPTASDGIFVDSRAYTELAFQPLLDFLGV